jgi:ssDNA-binding Zn-finger/Zn-ribbon topoisomerase 1
MKCPKCGKEMQESVADKRFYACHICKKLYPKRGLETVKGKETQPVTDNE